MSPAVELVQRALVALNAGNIEALLAICDRDFELDMSDRVFNPSTYRGHDGIRQFHAEVFDVGEHCVWEPEHQVLDFVASGGAGGALLRRPALVAPRAVEAGPEHVHRSVHDLLAGHVRVLVPPECEPGEP